MVQGHFVSDDDDLFDVDRLHMETFFKYLFCVMGTCEGDELFASLLREHRLLPFVLEKECSSPTTVFVACNLPSLNWSGFTDFLCKIP